MDRMGIPAGFGRKKLCDYEISLRYYGINSGQMVLNQYLSKLIKDSGLTKVQIKASNNKLFLVFNASKGYNVCFPNKKKNVTICTTQALKKILKAFNSQGFGSYRIHVSKNLSADSSCITIQLLNLYHLSELRESSTAPVEESSVVTPTNLAPDISVCIQILKTAGYIILAPKTHYVEV